jgi:hypothetical protein
MLNERLRFQNLISQMQVQPSLYGHQNYYLNMLRNQPFVPPTPNAAQILTEIEKILRSNPDPVFKRSEVRMLIKSIVESVVPPHDLLNLIKNPLTEPHSRETISTVINLISQAKQNAANELMPSVLQAHTDAIMQNAIIKKRIETLHNELMKINNNSPNGSTNPSLGRVGFPNQSPSFNRNASWQQQNAAALSPKYPQRFAQKVEAGPTTSEENLKRFFSPTVWNQALTGQFPSINSTTPLRKALRSEEYERTIKQNVLDGIENKK